MKLRVGLLCAALYITGCTYQAQPIVYSDGPAGEIERVLVQDQNLSRQMGNLRRQGYKNVAIVNWVAPRMRAIDTSSCPTDFRMAYLEHCNAWQDFAERLRTAPREWAERAALMVFSAYATKKVNPADVEQLLHPLRQGVEAIHSTWHDVEASAVQNGARIP